MMSHTSVPCIARGPAAIGEATGGFGVAKPTITRHVKVLSILLHVTGNVTYVMEQVGHSDQDTTNRIYRHLIRERQQHGAAFDRVVAEGSSAQISVYAPRND